MLKPRTTSRFEKDYRKARDSDRDLSRLGLVMTWIASGDDLPPELRDHPLVGRFKGRRECHLSWDWLLICMIEGDTVTFERTASHSDLFG